METSRLLLMLSVAFLALAALIGAALIAYAHQRRERSSQVVQDALSRSGAAAANEATTPARPADLLRSLNGDGVRLRTGSIPRLARRWLHRKTAFC
jgi:tight adherence protein C